jgi:hypothetical protein
MHGFVTAEVASSSLVVPAIFLEAPVEATIRGAQSLQDVFGKTRILVA